MLCVSLIHASVCQLVALPVRPPQPPSASPRPLPSARPAVMMQLPRLASRVLRPAAAIAVRRNVVSNMSVRSMASANSSAVRPAATASSSSSASSSGVAASGASVKSGKDGKMTIKFSLADTPGALQQALGYFARHGVNMTRLESRPARRTSDYVSTTPHCTHA